MTAGPRPTAPPAPPEWFAALLRRVPDQAPAAFQAMEPVPDDVAREAAVLILLGEGPDGPDVLLTERASTLRNHAGQVSFPGGRLEPADGGRSDVAALRETVEETGLDPAGVVVGGALPAVYLTFSSHRVTPVVAWWREPSAVAAVDVAEVAAVARVPVAELADPANRCTVVSPDGRYRSPVFLVGGMVVWGFTAGLLTWLLDLGGWTRPWDADRVVDIELPGIRRAEADR